LHRRSWYRGRDRDRTAASRRSAQRPGPSRDRRLGRDVHSFQDPTGCRDRLDSTDLSPEIVATPLDDHHPEAIDGLNGPGLAVRQSDAHPRSSDRQGSAAWDSQQRAVQTHRAASPSKILVAVASAGTSTARESDGVDLDAAPDDVEGESEPTWRSLIEEPRP